MFSLIPKLIYDNITDLTPELLKSHGIHVLLMDFDNTIVPYTCDTPKEAVVAWFAALKAAGIQLCVVSNTKRGRAVRFCNLYGIQCITHAQKPFKTGMNKALELYKENRGHIALVGDQIYTDILCANRCNVTSILIQPIHLHNIWLKLRHVLELPWIAIGRRRNVK